MEPQPKQTPNHFPILSSEASFKSIIAGHFDGVLIINQEGLIRYANPVAEEMFGHTTTELVNFPQGRLLIGGITTELDLYNRSGRRLVVECRVSEASWEGEPVSLVWLQNITDRKETEAKIYRQSELLAGILNSISASSVVIDPTGTIILANTAWNTFAHENGASSEKAGPGVNYLNVCRMAEKTDPAVLEITTGIGRVLEGRLPAFSHEYSLTLSGKTNWYLIHVDPLPADTGGAVISHTNVTELKLAARELEGSREHYRGVLNTMSEGVVILDLAGIIIGANPGAEKILGLSMAGIIGRTPFDLRWQAIYEDGVPFPGEAHPVMITLQTGQPCVGVIMGVRQPDNSLKWLMINSKPLFQPDGTTLRGVVASFSDITQNKRAEIAIRESEERFRLLAENSLDLVYTIKGDGTLLYISPACRFLLGFEPQELIGRNVFDRLHPADITRVQESLYHKPEDPRSTLVDFRFRHKTGHYVWLEINASRTWDPTSGKLLVATGAAREISDRKMAEVALHQREQEFRALVENSPDQIVRTDLNLRCLYANPEIARISQVPADYIIGKTGPELGVDPEAWKTWHHLRDKVLETGLPQAAEYEMVTSYGQYYFQTRMVPELNSEGKIETLLVVTRDLSELKKTQVALIEQERFKTLFELSPDAVALSDAEGRIISINPALETLTGLPREKILGQFASDLGLLDLPPMAGIMAEALKTKTEPVPLTSEVIFRHAEGGEITIEIKLLVVTINEQIHYLCTIRDISNRKKLEAELRQALEQQRELTELKNRIIATTSHEFRTPLAIIQATGEALELYLDRMTPVQISDRIGKIRSQIQHITKIWDDVLVFNRLQDKTIHNMPVSGDIIEFCRTQIMEIIALDDNSHQFSLLLPTTPRQTRFDKFMLQQLINNLLSNAVKYSPAGTEIEIEIKETAGGLQLKVIDHGLGIPAKDRGSIFEPFFRAGNTENIPGTGMGLSILKETLNLIGGDIGFTSQEGQGTTFLVMLPLDRQG